MKITNLFKSLAVLLIATTATDMEATDRKLPAPSFKGGMGANEIVASRHSTRDFDSSRGIDDAILGQLLWMSTGVNRPDAPARKFGKPADRSNPTALNWQEIRTYVFGKDAVWEYMPHDHSLKSVKEGDYRKLLGGTAEFFQDFVINAPYIVLFVADITGLPQDERTKYMAFVDAGIACENLNLACASLGMATVPRATMDSESISRLLGFTPTQIPVMNNPIGYAR